MARKDSSKVPCTNSIHKTVFYILKAHASIGWARCSSPAMKGVSGIKRDVKKKPINRKLKASHSVFLQSNNDRDSKRNPINRELKAINKNIETHAYLPPPPPGGGLKMQR